MVCLLAAPWVQLSVSAGSGWPHNALQHHWLMPISCHFQDCKALLVTSLTHVSGAIASVQTFTFFTFLWPLCNSRATCDTLPDCDRQTDGQLRPRFVMRHMVKYMNCGRPSLRRRNWRPQQSCIPGWSRRGTHAGTWWWSRQRAGLSEPPSNQTSAPQQLSLGTENYQKKPNKTP